MLISSRRRILATDINAKPNGVALFEKEAHRDFDELEAAYVAGGMMWQPVGKSSVWFAVAFSAAMRRSFR